MPSLSDKERVLGVLYWGVVVLWAATFLGALLWGWPVGVRFETNDDYWMMQIASGHYTGAPSEFLLYMHVGLGRLLKMLFTLWPSFNSYVALLLVLHLGFIGATTWSLSRRACESGGWLLLLAIAMLFHGLVYVRLQFTTSAFVGASGAILIALRLVMPSEAGRPSWLMLWYAAILWALAYGVRKEAAVLAALLAAPSFIYVLLKLRAYGSGAKFLAAAVGIATSLEIWNAAYLPQYPDWQRFMRFNAARGKVHVAPGYSYDAQSKGVYAQLGWSENDVKMFQQWFFPDPAVHSPEDVEILVRSLQRPLTPLAAVRAWRNTLAEQRFRVIAAMYLAAGILVAVPALWPALGGMVAVSILLQVYLQATARLPPRVLLPMLYAPFLFLLPVWPVEAMSKRSTRLRVWLIGAIVLVLWSVRQYARLGRQHAEMHAAWRQAQDEEARSGARVLVLWADDWPVEWERIGLICPKQSDRAYVSLSSLAQSPHHWAVLQRFGITNLVEAMLQRDDIALVCRAERLPYLKRYMREHHRVEVQPQDLGGIFSRRIYRLQAASRN
jgi:hypothetical protein